MKKLSYAEIVEILDFFQINIWYDLLLKPKSASPLELIKAQTVTLIYASKISIDGQTKVW